MTKRLTIWPSSVHRNLVCSASAYPLTQDDGTILHEEAGENAAVGRAVHRAIRAMIELGLDSPPDVTGICLDEGCGDAVTRVRVMAHYAARAWKEILSGVDPSVRRAGAQWAHMEEKAEQVTGIGGPGPADLLVRLSGIVDLYWEAQDQLYIVEWKSGQRDDSAAEQAKAYSALLSYGMDWAMVQVKLVWLQDQVTTTLTYTRAEIEDWHKNLARVTGNWDGKTFTPGSICRWCRNGLQCEARKRWLSQGVELFAGGGALDLTGIPAEKLGRAYDQAQILEDMIGKFREALRVHALTSGPIPRGDGKVIDCQPVQGRVSLNHEAIGALAVRYGGEEIDPLLRLDWGDVKEVVRAHAGKGGKGKEEARVLGEFIESGSASRGATFYKLTTRKEKEAVEACPGGSPA